MSGDSSLSSIYGDEEGLDNQGDENLDLYSILNLPRDVSFSVDS